MIFSIVLAGFFLFCLYVLVIKIKERIHKEKEKAEKIRSLSIHVEPFSLTAYFDRTEKLYISLLEEAENFKPEPIILWWGIDGLRLNDDGTTEWVRKEPIQEQKYGSWHESGFGCAGGIGNYIASDYSVLQDLDRIKNIISNNSLQTQTQCMQSEWNKLQFLRAQQIQNKIMMNSIQPFYYPQYYPNFYQGYMGQSIGRDIFGNII